jgi:hypothetical protein
MTPVGLFDFSSSCRVRLTFRLGVVVTFPSCCLVVVLVWLNWKMRFDQWLIHKWLRSSIGISTGRGMCGGSFPVPCPELPPGENLPPFPSLRGILIPVPIPTDPHGSCGDPRISNINKIFIFFSQIMIVFWRYFFLFYLKKQILYIYFF